MSCVTCHMSYVCATFFLELVGGGSVINGDYPVYFFLYYHESEELYCHYRAKSTEYRTRKFNSNYRIYRNFRKLCPLGRLEVRKNLYIEFPCSIFCTLYPIMAELQKPLANLRPKMSNVRKTVSHIPTILQFWLYIASL